MDTDLLSCIELETGAHPDAAVIWLHGLGADGNDFVPIVDEMRLPPSVAIRFVFPHAPVRPVTINAGMPMRAWYDIHAANLSERADMAGIKASQAQVEALLARERSRGIAARRIVLAGFSQGGAVALYTGLRHAERLAGIVALSTYLVRPGDLVAEASAANRDVPVFMAHGTVDPVVRLEWGDASRRALTAAGYERRVAHLRHAAFGRAGGDRRDQRVPRAGAAAGVIVGHRSRHVVQVGERGSTWGCGTWAGATGSPPTGTARDRKAMTALPKMSLRSPATMCAAFATLTYSACGHSRRKLCAPSSLSTSDSPPRTSSVGSFSAAGARFEALLAFVDVAHPRAKPRVPVPMVFAVGVRGAGSWPGRPDFADACGAAGNSRSPRRLPRANRSPSGFGVMNALIFSTPSISIRGAMSTMISAVAST